MEKEFRESTAADFIYFHRHPEISSEEYNTTEYIRKRLEECGIEILNTGLNTGLAARVGKSGPAVAVRCDIDALRIEEKTRLAYCSENKGVMHACGHDFHMASVLGAARLLKNMENELDGQVVIIFQPAEESATGAVEVINTGVLDDVQAIFGLHVNPEYDQGTIGIHIGGATAAVERFRMTVEGKGCHGAMPHQGIDPITISAQIIQSWQTMLGRCVDAIYPAVISVTQIHGGSTWNVIPQNVDLEGTVRTNNKDVRAFVMKKMRELAASEAQLWGAEARLDFLMGHPATDNDPQWSRFAFEVARECGMNTEETRPLMIGEDFAYYQEKIPGVLIWVGAGKTMPLHHPGLTLKPEAAADTAEYIAELAVRAVRRLKRND